MEASRSLARYGIKRTADGKYRSVLPSRFSKEYYPTFQLTRIPPANRFPFKLQKDSDGLEAQEKVLIDYKQESDFLLVDQQLSDLDRQILIFIGTFRHVQKYQIQKEVGPAVSGKRLDKSLKKLHRYFLIDAWEFPRQDKKGETATAYSITGNGSKFLAYHQLLEGQGYAQLDWQEKSCQPIRFWKIVDVYQMMKASAHYKGFSPRKSFSPKPYKAELIETRKNSLGEEQKTKKEKLIYLRPLQLDGEILFENPRLQYVFDLYPIATEEDFDQLQLALQHWEKLDEDYRYLVVIVDSWDRVEELHGRYRLAKGPANVLFFDLDSVQNNDLLSALYQYDQGSQSYQVLPFRLLHEK